ncbi:MAG: DUF481 domain-containing protein [Planctomycetota bacterium]|jgi:putative salt-induced outer membrane protein YdiY
MKKRGMVVIGLSLGVLASAALADQIELANGDTLSGHVVERTDDHIVFEHAQLGRIELPLSAVAASGDVAMGAMQSADAIKTEGELEAKADAAKKEKLWKGAFSLGGTAKFGNTDSQELSVGVDLKRETEKLRTKINVDYYYDASNGDRTDNKIRGTVYQDWLNKGSKWFYFLSGAYDYDEFESWEHRVAGHGGVGYHLIEDEKFWMDLRLGLGAVREFNSTNTDLRPEILLGYDLEWKISEKQSLTSRLRVFPDLDDTGEFRLIGNLGWKVLLDEEMNMSLFARLRDEYQSTVGGGDTKHNDLRIVVGLTFDF